MKVIDAARRWHAWWRFPHLRSFELHLWGRFWHGRHAWGKVLFGARREVWSSGESLTAWKLQGSIFRQLVAAIFVPALFAILLVAGLCHVVVLWPALDWPWGGWTLNAEAQLGYLSTLGQISAGMLTLYFTAISVVASTGYARVPGDIRTLIVQDQVGSFYFRILAQFAATTIVMLVALVFGLTLGPLNVLLASALALFSILSFWALGQRAFRLFDPTALSESLNQELAGAVTAVTPERFGWDEISLQAHNQRRAEQALNSYRNLIAIAAQPENAGGGRLVDLGRSLLAVLKFYVERKSRIPSKSFWFKRANKHKDWLLARQHELDIALATDTSLAPDQIPDLVWFEAHVAKLTEAIATELGRRDDFPGLARLADHLREVMDTFGRNCAVTEGLLVARIAGAPILERCRRVDFGAVTESDFNHTTQALAALELQSCNVIEAFLGTVRVIDQLSASAVERRVNRVVWGDAQSIYGPGPIPRQVVEQLEWLRGCLEFEVKVEGQIVSPAWLPVEMVSLGMVRFLHESVTRIMDETERCFGAVPPAGPAPHAVAEAENCLWGLEACNKLAKHIERYEALADELAAKNRSKEYQWPKVDWADMRKRIATLRNQLVVKLAGCAARLVTLPASGNWPDYFGRSYAVLGDEAFDAMARGDEQQFGQVFPTYFSCAFLAMDRLGKKPGSETRNYIIQMSPVKDLLDLSGYALLFSALDNKTFEATVKHCWDERFASNADPAWRAVQIALLVLIAEPSLWQEPSSTLRTRWHYGMDRLLRQRRIVTDRYDHFGEDDAPVHASPLVRAYARSMSVLFEAHDIFLSRYVYQRPEAAGLNKPHAIRSFDAEFDRENPPAAHG
ncbi:MAG: hypothetical protein Q8N18_18565 [Opitutaceae bacterium]|nr:hypothetical protein [Opitutaceae bacterium]